MKIILKQLTLINFKGIKDLTLNFNPETTNISGENGTGKTSINDAFNFLLFGKDSYDRKDFNIKTLDKDNNPIHKLSHEVKGIFDVDGIETSFHRVYKEKWVKPKGAEIAEMSGHETLFYYNDVPLSQAEYKAKVDSLIPEEKMKLLTNPMYFNSIKWDVRRKILMDITGKIEDGQMLDKIATPENQKEIDNLIEVLKSGKSDEEYKKQLAAKRKLLNDELYEIPIKIGEANRSLPKVENWTEIVKEIERVNGELIDVQKQMDDKNDTFKGELEKAKLLQQQKHNLEVQLTKLQNDAKVAGTKEAMEIDNQINISNTKYSNLRSEVAQLENQISKHNNTINQLTESNNQLREKWNIENARELAIDENSLNCPTCKQPLPEDEAETKRESFTANFNKDKQANLTRIEQQGVSDKAEIESAEKRVEDLRNQVLLLNETIAKEDVNINELQVRKDGATSFVPEISQEEISIKSQIDAIVIPESMEVDISDLKSKRLELTLELDNLKAKYATKEQIDRINTRISELEKQEKDLAQQISSIERTEFVVQSFGRAKIEELDRRLNELFPNVQFKLFNNLINGGTEPCCEMLVGGVPFNDVNTAGRINAGLSIINVLIDYYCVSLPIFIDNKESVNNPIKCKAQTIFLTVGKEKELTILN